MTMFGGRSWVVELHPRDSQGNAAAFLFGGEDDVGFVGGDGIGGFESGGGPGDAVALGGGEVGDACFFVIAGVA